MAIPLLMEKEAVIKEMECVSSKMKPYRILAIFFSIIVVVSILPLGVSDNAQGGKYGDITPILYELALLEKINENRTQNGVAPVSLNASLTWAARAHTQDMIDYDFFNHTSSQQGQFNGATFNERVTSYAEYESGYVGECIAWTSWGIDVEWTMAAWKNSPPHWDIIINQNFHEIGIGLIEGEWDGYSNAGLHTVDFGGHATSVDLSVDGMDIGFEPSSPTEGDIVTISAQIKNEGFTDAHPVIVKFYDGDPQSGGILLGTKQNSEILIHGENRIVDFLWDTHGDAGDHNIYVVMDPENLISESDEENNIAYKFLTIDIMNPPLNLSYGWNLISFPYTATDTSLDNVLSSISGKYDRVQFYDSSQSPHKWLNHNTRKPQDTNHLGDLNNDMGFWIHVTDLDGAQLVVEGENPISSQIVNLKKGWNLVGYPSSNSRLRNIALNNLDLGDEIEMVQGYDSNNKIHINIGENDCMEPGQGYFILANYDCQWIVNP